MRTKGHNKTVVVITALALVSLTPTLVFAQASFTFLPGHPQGSQIVDPTEPFEGFGIAIPKDDPIQLTDAVTIFGQINVTVTDSTTETGERVRTVTLTFTGPEGDPGRITNTTDRTVDLPFIEFATVKFNEFPRGKGKLSVKFEGTLRNTTGRSIDGGEIFQLTFTADNFAPSGGGEPSASQFFYASGSDSPGVDPDEPLPSETPMQGRNLFGVADVSRDRNTEGEFREGAGTLDAALWLVLGPKEEIVAPESIVFTAKVTTDIGPPPGMLVVIIGILLAVALLLLALCVKKIFKGGATKKTVNG